MIFYTNGLGHWLWDDARGYPPREVQGFFTRDELELLIQRRQTRRPLAGETVNAPHDVSELEQMLEASGAGARADLDRAVEEAHGLGRFVRSLVGLDREAALEAFGEYLDGAQFDVNQVRFVNLIIDELTANGAVDPGRLFESPFTDHAPTGPDDLFAETEVDSIVGILRDVDERTQPLGA